VLPVAAAPKAEAERREAVQQAAVDKLAEAVRAAAVLQAVHPRRAAATLAAVRAVIPLLAVPVAAAAAQDLKAAASKAAA
jgi:hypothetical protein